VGGEFCAAATEAERESSADVLSASIVREFIVFLLFADEDPKICDGLWPGLTQRSRYRHCKMARVAPNKRRVCDVPADHHCGNIIRRRIRRGMAYHRGSWAGPRFQEARRANNKDRETLKLKEIELALARFDFDDHPADKVGREGSATPEIIARIARLQELRDVLDVQVGLAQIIEGTYLRRRHRRLYS
jgi:hypothetical protein